MLGKLRKWPSVEKRRIMVWYDGRCPLCTTFARVLHRMDILKFVVFVSFRHVDPWELPVPIERLERRMYSRCVPDGRLLDGIRSVIQICWRIPVLWPVGGVLMLLDKVGLGQPAYDVLAVRRMLIPVGHCIAGRCNTNKTDRAGDVAHA